jgi:hypothetical protein
MAWEWSHTPEAYADAEANLRDLPRNELKTIFAEWKVLEYAGKTDLGAFYTERKKARRFTNEQLADEIWRHASEKRTCSNGGHDCWVCPHGCHTVSFTRTAPSSR